MAENTLPDQNTGIPQNAGDLQNAGKAPQNDFIPAKQSQENLNLKAPLSFAPTEDDIGLRLVTKDGKNELAAIDGAGDESADASSADLRRIKRPRKKWTRRKQEVETHEVYFEDTFFDKLIKDLENATTLIIIHCPFIKDYRLRKLIDTLKACIERGVRVCVFIKYPEEGFDTPKEIEQRIELSVALLEIRCHVTLRLNIHEKLIIIDEFIFWEGSCNTLSQAGSYERLPRWHGRKKVLEVIQSHGLRDCRECHVNRLRAGAIIAPTATKRQILGAIIRKRRMEMSLSQRDLAASVAVSRSVIHDVESGLGDPRLSSLEKICEILHLEIRLVLWIFIPSLDETLTRESTPPQLRVQKARRSPWDKDSNELYEPGEITRVKRESEYREMLMNPTFEEPEYLNDPGYYGHNDN